jgi:hypothetical protein
VSHENAAPLPSLLVDALKESARCATDCTLTATYRPHEIAAGCLMVEVVHNDDLIAFALPNGNALSELGPAWRERSAHLHPVQQRLATLQRLLAEASDLAAQLAKEVTR